MEEINIFLDNKISIFYLSLFDNFIKDENYFKIGNYTLDNHNLDITYDNGEKFNYSYLKTDNNKPIDSATQEVTHININKLIKFIPW